MPKASVFHHILLQLRSITLKSADLPLDCTKIFFEHASPSADLRIQTEHSVFLNSWLFLSAALF